MPKLTLKEKERLEETLTIKGLVFIPKNKKCYIGQILEILPKAKSEDIKYLMNNKGNTISYIVSQMHQDGLRATSTAVGSHRAHTCICYELEGN